MLPESQCRSHKGGVKGDEKRTKATELVLALLTAYEGLKDSDEFDEEALAENIGCIIDGVVGVLNEAGVLKD